jgi:hypothetical protein
MANFFSLPIADQAKLAQDSLFKYYGVTIPVTTEQSKNNLTKAQNSYIPAINQINSALWQGPLGPNGQPNPSRAAAARAANNAPIPPEIKNQLASLLPAGYTFDGTLGQFANTLNAVSTSVDNVIRNEIQLPPMGAGVTYNPNNTTPPVGTVVTPTTPTIPTNTAPATTTAPSTNTSSSAISNILTAAAVIGGGALIVNALNNRVQNSTATPVPPADNPNPIPASTAAFDDANASPQQVIDPNSDPNTNIGTEGQTIENASPATINADDAIEKARLEAEAINGEIPPRTEQDIFAAEGVTNAAGLQGKIENARAQQITQDAENAKTQGDWRVRLSLAPSAGYLYKAQNPGILAPLQKTDGVIFPYIPQIQVIYAAHYDPAELIHSNYKIFQYKNSSVDQISITCDFTAQDTAEANYMLAVIHFFRSVTKMFYGQDEIPKLGTPPPLCYLSGLGDFQFDRHPLVISSFNYNLPNDVDYIRAGSATLLSGVNSSSYNDNRNSDATPTQIRLQSGSTPLNTGATQSAPNFSKATNTQPTYVPTKISISLVAYPIVTRNAISNTFSLKDYATGKLLQGSKNPGGGGIW